MDHHNIAATPPSAVEAAAQAQARRMQQSSSSNSSYDHQGSFPGNMGEVGGQQYFNPAAMMPMAGSLNQHSRNMSYDSAASGSSYMHLPPIGGSNAQSGYGHGHDSSSHAHSFQPPQQGQHGHGGHGAQGQGQQQQQHQQQQQQQQHQQQPSSGNHQHPVPFDGTQPHQTQSPRVLEGTPQQHHSNVPMFGSPPGSANYPSPYSHQPGHHQSFPNQSPSTANAHIPGQQQQHTGSMPMYNYHPGLPHASPQQHYSHIPGSSVGLPGLNSVVGSHNPMLGSGSALPSGSSEYGMSNHQYGQMHQPQHYSQHFPPGGGMPAMPPGQVAYGGAHPPNAPLSTVSGLGSQVQNSSGSATVAPAPSRVKKSKSPDREKAKDRHHPYAHEAEEAKTSTKKKEKKVAEEPAAPKPPVLKSHLKPPKQAPSAWQIFFTEELQKIKAHSPEERLNVAHVAKDAGQRYAALSDEAKVEFQRRSQDAKEQWERDMESWKATLTPEDIKQENLFRTAQRKAGKSRKGNLKDPNAPKKPLSAYFLFLRAIRADPAMTQEVFEGEQETTKQSVLAAAKWRALSEAEKQPYLEKAERDKTTYERLRREYEIAHGLAGDSAPGGGNAADDAAP